ncbi:GTPase [Nanoarchaeota archaeon]
MPINAGPEYGVASKQFLAAITTEEKIAGLEEMIKHAPKHKGSENLLAGLRSRLSKLKKELKKEGTKKRGRSTGVKKEGDAQIVIIGFPNSGKSTLLTKLTNAKPQIEDYPFTTTKPEIGTLNLGGINVQTVELPPLTIGEDFREWLSVAKVAEIVLILATSLPELSKISTYLKKENTFTPKIFLINKSDILPESEIKKLSLFKNAFKISAKTGEGLDELKKKIFEDLELIRVYTKEPGKEHTKQPLVLNEGSKIEDMASKVHKDFLRKFKFAKIWGKSAKFPGQGVGIEHRLKDKDIVELHLR